jgi:hypothetical protein
MKFNDKTIFPIALMIFGAANFLRDGNSGIFTGILPIKLGLWQQPVGALIFLIGFILYKRSAK